VYVVVQLEDPAEPESEQVPDPNEPPPLVVNETMPDGAEVAPPVVSLTVAVHTDCEPAVTVPGEHATATDTGRGWTVNVVAAVPGGYTESPP